MNKSVLTAVFLAANGDPTDGVTAGERSPPLKRSLANVSDEDAIATVQRTAMSADERNDLWQARYEQSPMLQAEFRDPKVYAAYMNAAAQSRVRIKSASTVVSVRREAAVAADGRAE